MNVGPQPDIPSTTDDSCAVRMDDGMTTAEYAIGTLAACGFAALLVTILRSGEVQGLLMGVIRHALALGG
jgi:hypothetical protein